MVADRYDAGHRRCGRPACHPRHSRRRQGQNVTVATDAIMHSEQDRQATWWSSAAVKWAWRPVCSWRRTGQHGHRHRDAGSSWLRTPPSCTTAPCSQMAWEAIPTFHYVLSATAKAIAADHVTYTDKDGVDHDLPADSVILSVGMRSKSDEALSLLRHKRPASIWWATAGSPAPSRPPTAALTSLPRTFNRQTKSRRFGTSHWSAFCSFYIRYASWVSFPAAFRWALARSASSFSRSFLALGSS